MNETNPVKPMNNINGPSTKPASAPAPDNFPTEWLTASGPKAKAIKDWIKSNNPPDLALLMDLYKVLVFQFMRDKGPTEDCIRQVTPMLRTITSYEQNLSRQNHRERALKLKESEHEMEMAEADRKDAQELADQEAAEEFAASQTAEAEGIAEVNKMYTKDVDILKEHYDVIMPDEKNPIARVYEKVPGINPLGLTVTPREPAVMNDLPTPKKAPDSIPAAANPGVVVPIHNPPSPPVRVPAGPASCRRRSG